LTSTKPARRIAPLQRPARKPESVKWSLDGLDLGGLAPDAGPLFGADVETPRRDSLGRRALAVGDVAGLCAAYGVMRLLTPASQDLHHLLLLLALPLWVVLNKALRLYDRDTNLIHKSTLNEFPAILQSIALGTAVIVLAGPPILGVSLGRDQALVFWLAASAFTPMLRFAARTFVRTRVAAERCLIVGSGTVAQLVADKITSHPEYGATIVGYLDVSTVANDTDLPLLGDVEDFEGICRSYDVERVVIAFSSLSHEHLLDVIRRSKRLRLKITIVPRLFEVIGHGVEIDQIEGMTLLGLRGLTRTQSTLMLKRGIDIAGAGIGLLLLSPFLLCIALAIKLTSPGPVFFSQRRVGRRNREFTMYKFRTMVVGAEDLKAELAHLNDLRGTPMFKIADDPRVTRVGRFLRRASLDEIPQLWNVVRGEMSLVGPRPLVPAENDHVVGWHRARLDLTPGLTGPWQVMGRSAIPFAEMVKLDYLYVADWSLWNDIKLLMRTLPVVALRRGH
jgi:exopolysaccharide biosynthesis polyprenyl glycosylphosphotransferase